jgi:sulfotransferase family protein
MDFIVIGGQKAGTTTFWHHLASHPQVFVPESKEAPFFSHDAQYLRGLEWHRARHFAAAPPGALLGTVTPHYMMGTPDAPVGRIAARIHKALPDVRLIALLRDPVERALSQYRMSVRRGLETRSFAGAVQELLEPDRLLEGRSRANETNSYIVQGEYGRVLDAYLQHFPRDQLLVLLTDDLDRRPAEVVKTAFAFLGVDDTFVPPNLGAHEFRGGLIPRLDRAAETELHDWLGEHVWPKLPNAAAERRAFRFWFKTWNVVPDAAPPISPATRRVLERHYRRDASRLRKLGVQAPWAAAKRQRPRVHPDPAPLVITGIGGSGTRAFMRIAEAAGCYMGRNVNRSGDAMELYEIAERWAAAVHWSWVASEPLADAERIRRELVAALARHCADVRDQPGPWGWKQPRSIHLLPALHDLYPGLRVLHVVRDGRDVAFGKTIHLKLTKDFILEPSSREEPVPVQMMRLWERANQLAADFGEHRLGDRYLRLTFEELCTRPADTAQAIALFATGRSRADVVDLVHAPASIGRWRTADPALAAAVTTVGRGALERFGYLPARDRERGLAPSFPAS